MPLINLQKLFNELKVDENDEKVEKRRKLIDGKLAYLKEFKLTLSRDSVIDAFKNNEEIGKGAFGKVLKVKIHEKELAIKMIQLSLKEKEDVKNLREVDMTKRLSHENTVGFIDYLIEFDEKENVWVNLFMELCQSNLAKWYDEDMERNYNDCAAKFVQITNGLKYIHSQKIIHRDLKPENILIDFSGTCKIADFGLSTLHSTKYGYNHTCNLGTFLYAAPEQLKDRDYDFKADIFSLGLILVGLLVKFENETELKDALILIKEDLELPDTFIVKFNSEGNLILEMTQNDPNLRPTTEQVMEKFVLIFESSLSHSGKSDAGIDDAINAVDETNRQRRQLLESDLSYLKEYKISMDSIFDEMAEIELITYGRFGRIYKTTDKNGRKLAIKSIPLYATKEWNVKMLEEVKMNSKFSHENLVKFYDHWIEFNEQNKVKLYISMELCKCNLGVWLKKTPRIYKQSIEMFSQICSGLSYIHSKGIIHRDLSPLHILIDFNGICKIGNFTLALSNTKKLEIDLVSYSNFYFTAPELFLAPQAQEPTDISIDFKVDVFSLGMIFMRLLFKFENERLRLKVYKKLRDDHILPYQIESLFKHEGKMILEMTEIDPKRRTNLESVRKKIGNLLTLTALVDSISAITGAQLDEMKANAINKIN